MIEAPTPTNEKERQEAVDSYKILDSLPESIYDDITSLMSRVCDAPISLAGLIDKDRHWLKSHHGIDFNESPRNISFCGHAIVSKEEIFIVEDARKDERFFDNPLVTDFGVVGYAGVPFVDKDGFVLGTLCVFDLKPMILSEDQKESLKSMARQVMYLFERHIREAKLEETTVELKNKNTELEQYAGILSHDIKTPINHIVGFIEIIEDEIASTISDDMLDYFNNVKSSSLELKKYIDGLLKYYTNNKLLKYEPESFKVKDILANMDKIASRDKNTTLELPNTDATIHTNKAALTQILLNLISNAIKYGNKKHTRIKIDFYKSDTNNHFIVSDNGIGIAPENQKSIFELFGKVDDECGKGTGVGLATISKLVANLGGTIGVESELGKGSKFTVILPRRF